MAKIKKKTKIKLRPYRVDFFLLSEMKNDLARVWSKTMRAASKADAEQIFSELVLEDKRILKIERDYKDSAPVQGEYIEIAKLMPDDEAVALMETLYPTLSGVPMFSEDGLKTLGASLCYPIDTQWVTELSKAFHRTVSIEGSNIEAACSKLAAEVTATLADELATAQAATAQADSELTVALDRAQQAEESVLALQHALSSTEQILTETKVRVREWQDLYHEILQACPHCGGVGLTEKSGFADYCICPFSYQVAEARGDVHPGLVPDIDNLATLLGAERGGEVVAKSGFFGAMQTAADIATRDVCCTPTAPEQEERPYIWQPPEERLHGFEPWRQMEPTQTVATDVSTGSMWRSRWATILGVTAAVLSIVYLLTR